MKKFIFICSMLLACGRVEENSKPDFTLGLSQVDMMRGHEDLTRFAVDMANLKIKEQIGLSDYYTAIPIGENAGRSSLPLIKGSFDTDWAVTLVRGIRSGEDMLNFYGAAWVQSGDEWQAFPWLQSMHFLRDRDANNVIYSKEESLTSARQKIIDAFMQAVRVSKNRRKSDYWLGHTLHIVQDSFSSAHTLRSSDFRTIKNLCTFGEYTVVDACKHVEPMSFEGAHPLTGELFGHDRIWSEKSSCDETTDPRLRIGDPRLAAIRDWSCLKPEAQKAAEVSAGVLLLFSEIVGNGLRSPSTDGHDEIEDFLMNPRRWQGGNFRGEWEN